MITFTTKRDLRNWVDNATSSWLNRHDSDVDKLTEIIRTDANFPSWGQDCTDYVESLELTELLD